jgi:hypothetical protein
LKNIRPQTSIFPELTQNGHNNSSYPTYIAVNDNDIVLNAKVVLRGGISAAANTLNVNGLRADVQNEVNNITARPYLLFK